MALQFSFWATSVRSRLISAFRQSDIGIGLSAPDSQLSRHHPPDRLVASVLIESERPIHELPRIESHFGSSLCFRPLLGSVNQSGPNALSPEVCEYHQALQVPVSMAYPERIWFVLSYVDFYKPYHVVRCLSHKDGRVAIVDDPFEAPVKVGILVTAGRQAQTHEPVWHPADMQLVELEVQPTQSFTVGKFCQSDNDTIHTLSIMHWCKIFVQ
jgi:hypothetical protein